jgi:hypothetical protein
MATPLNHLLNFSAKSLCVIKFLMSQRAAGCPSTRSKKLSSHNTSKILSDLGIVLLPLTIVFFMPF